MNRKLLTVFIFVLSFFLYAYKMDNAIFYHPDLARDLYEILKITQGNLTLIGPKLTFGGLYTGPYYYYLFVPIFFLTGGSILSIYYFNAALFAMATTYFFWISSKYISIQKSLLASPAIILLPIFLIGSRNPSNAYSFIPLLLMILTYLYFESVYKNLMIFILGVMTGVIINFHFLNIILLPSLLIIILYSLKNKKTILYFLAGFLIAFLPLILFEIKHNFVIFKNTFIEKSYLSWVTNKNISGGLSAKKNIIENIFFMDKEIASLTLLNPLIIYLFLPFSFYPKKFSGRNLIFFISAILGFVIFSATIRFQFISHYLFGISFFLFFAALVILSKSRFFMVAIVFFILIELFNFPNNIYKKSIRRPESFEKAVTFVVNNHLIEKDSSFNIIQITKENLPATIGFEYRFFFLKNGYIPNSEFVYNSSRVLLVFSERPDLKLEDFNSWEKDQFGKEHFIKAQKYKVDNLTIYKIEK